MLLNGVETSDALQQFRRRGGSLGLMDIPDLAARMPPTSDFKDAIASVECPETDISASENVLAGLEQDIAEAEADRDSCQETSGLAGTRQAATKARLDVLLSAVPETLRDREWTGRHRLMRHTRFEKRPLIRG
ncbi:MAG: hypothetical protein ACYC5H_06665 [Methylovirgula sp.]